MSVVSVPKTHQAHTLPWQNLKISRIQADNCAGLRDATNLEGIVPRQLVLLAEEAFPNVVCGHCEKIDHWFPRPQRAPTTGTTLPAALHKGSIFLKKSENKKQTTPPPHYS